MPPVQINGLDAVCWQPKAFMRSWKSEANEAIDAEIGAAQQRTAEIEAEIADRLVLKRAVRAGLGRDSGREVFVLEIAAGQQTAAGIALPEKTGAMVDADQGFERMRLQAAISQPRIQSIAR